MQIQVGALLPGAFVNASSVRWLDPPSDIRANVLTFDYDHRRLLLSDVFFDDAVLTGVQFYQQPNETPLFALKIFGRELNKPELDGLSAREYFKVVSAPRIFEAKSLVLTIPGLEPTKKTFEVTYGGANNTFIIFGASNEVADVGQTFVPFFDGVAVTFDSPSPLSGVGLMHYTNSKDFAGYLRPFLRSFNYAEHLEYYEKYLQPAKSEELLASRATSLIGERFVFAGIILITVVNFDRFSCMS